MYSPSRAVRRIVCGTLVIGLAVFAVQTAHHSVHHLWSTDRSCVLASAASDVHAVGPDPVAAEGVTPVSFDLVTVAAATDLSSRPAGRHRSRAPPSPSLSA